MTGTRFYIIIYTYRKKYIIKIKKLIPVVTFLTPLRLQINQDFQ